MWYFPALLDLKVRQFVLENRNPYMNAYFKTVNYGGDGLIVGTAWALYRGYGKISNDSGIVGWGRDG
jgi:hypothetical protein